MWTTTIETPIGILRAVADDEGLRCLLWPGLDPSRYRLPKRAISAAERPIFARLRAQLAEYFAGTRTSFDLPLAPQGTAFQRAAWEALRRIPYGTTRTYAQQAEAIGRPRAVRAIGAANGRNPISIVVPCHRVIGHDGSLTGFAGGLHAKRSLLQHEARTLDARALEPAVQGP